MKGSLLVTGRNVNSRVLLGEPATRASSVSEPLTYEPTQAFLNDATPKEFFSF